MIIANLTMNAKEILMAYLTQIPCLWKGETFPPLLLCSGKTTWQQWTEKTFFHSLVGAEKGKNLVQKSWSRFVVFHNMWRTTEDQRLLFWGALSKVT